MAAALLVVAGCAPMLKHIQHSGKTPEARMCEMQAERARDYCSRTANSCDGPTVSADNKKCMRCWDEFTEAFTTCGGSVTTICTKHCNKLEDRKLENQTQD